MTGKRQCIDIASNWEKLQMNRERRERESSFNFRVVRG
jgi:hypothetical protein